MKCPICLKATEVTDSRISGGGTVRRRRRCLNEHRFTTNEIVVKVDNAAGLRLHAKGE